MTTTWLRTHSFIVRVTLGAACTAVAALIGLGWPAGWASWLRNAILAVVAFLAVILIELAREHGRGARVESTPASTVEQRVIESPTANGRPAPRPEVVEPLPEKATFRGRRDDLRHLTRLHAARVADVRRDGTLDGRPVLIFIHGKAGIGKSALAQELARRLGPAYPDGQLYANLGTAGEALSAGETLKAFLDALGWRGDMPANQADRAKILRTLTAGKKYLFILDAARNHRQVFDVLPSDSGCAAIVTSRRDITSPIGLPSYELGLLTPDDAIDMLYAVARTNPLVSLECAVEVVEHCGRLPRAIQSAGERVSLEGSTMCEVALALRGENTRLYWLTRQGIVVAEGFETEYGTLNGAEQEAFRYLGQLAADTFVPWVLCSMLDISLGEAEDVCARLNRAQLIDFVSRDPASGLVRYRLHPLVRLFARDRLVAEGHEERARLALERFDEASSRLVRAVVDRIDGRVGPDDGLTPEARALAAVLAANPDEWARLEYPHAVRALEAAAARDDLDLCWRIGLRLGGVIASDDAAEGVRRTFGAAIAAADASADAVAGVDVRLAYASSLIALERYAESHAVLAEAERLAFSANGARPNPAFWLRRGKMHLKRGEAFLQMRRPREAKAEFLLATPVFGTLAAQAELRLVRILEALNVDFNYEDPYDEVVAEFGDSYKFWAILERYEERRRQRAWSDADEQLDLAAECSLGDLRKGANLLYRRGKLCLLHGAADDCDHEAAHRLATKAAYRAAEAMRAFERMGNIVGQVRAGCLLSRALVAAGRLAEARQQIIAAEQRLARLPVHSELAREPLRGRLLLARGVALLAASDLQRAEEVLFAAASVFKELDDGRSLKAAVDLLPLTEDPTRLGDIPRTRSSDHDSQDLTP